ncbi:unnamed protein product [Pylaiella littoralis]
MESKAEAKDDAIGGGVEVEDLTKGAKSLRHADTPQEHVEEKASAEELEPYQRLFQHHEGDLRAIFNALGENPGKALKYPPKNAVEFARIYTKGGYTYTQDAAAKSPRK